MLGSSPTSLSPKRSRNSFVDLVENGPSDDGLASGGGDQLAVQQRGDDAARIHAANLADLGHGDRLLVGDHGQSLERRQREPNRRLQALGEIADHVMLLGLGGHAISARDLANLDAAVGSSAIVDQFLKRDADARLDLILGRAFGNRRLFQQLDNVVERDRRFRRINNRFEFRFKTHG